MFASTINMFLGTILLSIVIAVAMVLMFARSVARGASNVVGRLFNR